MFESKFVLFEGHLRTTEMAEQTKKASNFQTREKSLTKKTRSISSTYNIHAQDEKLFWRMTRAQFHQRSMYSFYARRSQMRKNRQSSWQCCLTLLGPTSVKAVHKTLMKLSPGVNFINIYEQLLRAQIFLKFVIRSYISNFFEAC